MASFTPLSFDTIAQLVSFLGKMKQVGFPLPSFALTLLVGQQEGHPACKKTGCWFVGGDDLPGALHDL